MLPTRRCGNYFNIKVKDVCVGLCGASQFGDQQSKDEEAYVVTKETTEVKY